MLSVQAVNWPPSCVPLPVPSFTLQEDLKSEHVAKLACVPKGELHSLFPMGLPKGFAKQVRCT